MDMLWSRLSKKRLGYFSEKFAAAVMAFYGFYIYTTEIDDHGIDFIAERKDRELLKIQVKSARLVGTRYVYMKKRDFNISDSGLYLFLTLFKDGELPKAYMIPASVWNDCSGSSLFVYHGNYAVPEYGVNLSDKNMTELEKYSIEDTLAKK